MLEEIKFSSKRFLLTLTLCACSVILLQNGDLAKGSSFTHQALSMLCGLAVCAVLFIPALIIKKRTDGGLTDMLRPKAQTVIMLLYGVYFLYAAVYFLIPYTDMFTKKYYPEASPCLIAFLLCAVCVYAALKGANVISRFAIFLFILAMLTNFLMFGGAASELNFSHQGFEWKGSLGEFFQNTNYFMTPAFIVVIYVFLSGYTKNFKLRQPLLALLFTGIKYALVLFFICFAAGTYAGRQEYQTFVLSRVAHFGSFAGIESFYMALATMSVFLIVSLLICCACRGFSGERRLPFVCAASAAVFLLHTAAVYHHTLREFLVNPYVFNICTFIAAFLIPLIVLFKRSFSHA